MDFPAVDARLHAEVYGNADSRLPVVLIHGLGGCARTWGGIPQILSARWRVAALDLRGCGRSERGSAPVSLERLSEDVLCMIEALGADEAHLVGHSLGGVIAQDLLVRHGDRCGAAVLISTSSTVGAKASEGWRRLADAVQARGAVGDAGAARGFSEAFAAANPRVVEEYAQLSTQCSAAVYAEQARAASSYDYSPALPRVTNPVLVIQGLADRLTSPGGSVLLDRALANSELKMIDGVGHNLHVEMPDGLAAIIDEFLCRQKA